MSSTAADSSIDICSRALILIGADPITSFTDGSTESLVASNLYEDICRSALQNCRWRFATEQSVLNQLSDVPTGRFDIAHQLPSNLLVLHGITINLHLLFFNTWQPLSKLFKTKRYFFLLVLLVN